MNHPISVIMIKTILCSMTNGYSRVFDNNDKIGDNKPNKPMCYLLFY